MFFQFGILLCCNNDFVMNSALINLNEMTTPGESTTNQLLQKLLTTISTLQNDLKNLKSRQKYLQKYPQKQSRDGKGDEKSVSHNGDNDNRHNCDQEPVPANETEHNMSDGSCLILLEEVKAFLEATLGRTQRSPTKFQRTYQTQEMFMDALQLGVRRFCRQNNLEK